MTSESVWWVPACVNNYKGNLSKLEPKDIVLFAMNNTESGEFIPIFHQSEDCDAFLHNLTTEYQDIVFAAMTFRTLVDIRDVVKAEFDRDIKMVIKEGTKCPTE